MKWNRFPYTQFSVLFDLIDFRNIHRYHFHHISFRSPGVVRHFKLVQRFTCAPYRRLELNCITVLIRRAKLYRNILFPNYFLSCLQLAMPTGVCFPNKMHMQCVDIYAKPSFVHILLHARRCLKLWVSTYDQCFHKLLPIFNIYKKFRGKISLHSTARVDLWFNAWRSVYCVHHTQLFTQQLFAH